MSTPRGPVQIVRQEKRGLIQGLGWQPFWVACRAGQRQWVEASTAREAIRRAVLLSGGKTPGWLIAAGDDAERQIQAAEATPEAAAENDPAQPQ